MSPNDWIPIGFLAVVLVLSLAGRWHRIREHQEWAQFHAPLSGDTSDLHIDVALLEAKAATSACPNCGFQNFSSKIFCAMCRQSLAGIKANCVCGNSPPTRSISEWTRKIADSGKLCWSRNNDATATAWPSYYAVRFEPAPQPETDDVSGVSTGTLVLEDPSTSDPTSTFSRAWHEATLTPEQLARHLVAAQQQSFPTRMADFAVQVHTEHQPNATLSPTTISLHRESLLHESVDALVRLSPSQSRAAIRVSFTGEPGIDAGGVYREWLSLFSEQLAQPDAGIFTCGDKENQYLYLNPHSADVLGSEHHLAYFLAAGRVVGRALVGGDTLGLHFAPPLLKLMLGEPVGFPDLAGFDPELHRHLQWLVYNDGVEQLGLDFSVCEPRTSGEPLVVDLVEHGREIPVTDANKLEYINCITLHRLVHSVSGQLGAFLRGVYDVVPLESLALFGVDELDYMLSGGSDDAIDVDDWERHTRYTPDLWHHPTRHWFWQIVRGMPRDYQRRLLQFATGATRAPLVGFRGLTSYDGRLAPFTLVGRPLADEGFVRSHACFNQLDVPRYVNKNHLQRGLYALLETDVHGFSTQ